MEHGTQIPFDEQRFPCTIPVHVTFTDHDGYTFGIVDKVRGLNVGHALYRARNNWPTGSVRILGDSLPTKG